MKKSLFLLVFGFCVFTANAQNTFAFRVSNAALGIIDKTIVYDPVYFILPYPNGDVPANKGVCTDVIIRAYRKVGIDLQKEVHEDMEKNFSKYPKTWGLKKPDTNIDHRRVPNLAVFFSTFGKQKSIETNPALYVPGDIVTWILPGNLTHIGIVVNKKSAEGKRFLIVHNIGAGQVLEDVLFKYTVTGHYQYPK